MTPRLSWPPFWIDLLLDFPSLSFPSLPIRLPGVPSFFLLVYQICSFEGYIYSYVRKNRPTFQRPFKKLTKRRCFVLALLFALVLLEIDEIIIAIYSFKSTDGLYLIL